MRQNHLYHAYYELDSRKYMKQLIIAFLSIIGANCFASYLAIESHIHPIHTDKIQQIIESHFHTYYQKEYFSAIQVSVKTANKVKTYVAGRVSHDTNAKPITENSLFNIGSITKSFTSALMLIAQSEHKLHLTTNLNHYLDNYPHWSHLQLSQLLNMTSGLPNYTDSPKMNYLFSQNLKKFWTKPELINLVYTPSANPPLKRGYFYSNTGYIIAAMILESRYSKPFAELLNKKIIARLHLENTYYPSPIYSSTVFDHLVHGYNYNVYANPELVGSDVKENNLSWAGAAGGIVANSSDVVRWVEELFIKNTLLNKPQKQLMQQLISQKTGQPIKQLSSKESSGFGLGIIQKLDTNLGRVWYYQGETLGYRALYMYTPCNGVIISALFNSAVNNENNHAHLLINTIYAQLMTANKQLRCSL
jgi:D-alanyl-D-alanine carboxypeptidase